jgi:hypothetical protein
MSLVLLAGGVLAGMGTLVWLACRDWGPEWTPNKVGLGSFVRMNEEVVLHVEPFNDETGIVNAWRAYIAYEGGTHRMGGAFETEGRARRAVYAEYKKFQKHLDPM